MNQTITKTLIVDDEVRSALLLQKLLESYPVFGKTKAINDPVSAFQEIVNTKPQYLFLDVEMPEINGLQLHEKIREHTPGTRVIYITGYEKYALDALRLNPFDFLVKPVSRIDLFRIQEKILKNVYPGEYNKPQDQNYSSRVLIKNHNGTHQVAVEDIVYLEADSSYTDIFLKNNKKITSGCNMGKILPLLPSGHFLRISRKHLVNRSYISFYNSKDKYLILETPDQEYRMEVGIKVHELKKLLDK